MLSMITHQGHDWPEYVCHKRVRALPIDRLGDIRGSLPDSGTIEVFLATGECLLVDVQVFARGFPSSGDYMVRYGDGYLSWSPKNKFTEGYTMVDDARYPTPQAPMA